MLQILKRLTVLLAAALLAQSAMGFALLGPRDTWQVNTLGYDPQGDFGDLGGPKNLGEEWRWNIPEITYGYDASFLTFFGTNGMNAVESALAAFNREMTNFAGITRAQLLAKPRETRRVHATAQTLGILDLKTVAMGFLAEQLGLASAERFTWTIRGRAAFANVTNYSVIKRNFDPFTYNPTPYVNGVRYSYSIRQYPAANFGQDFEAAATFPVRQEDGERAVSLSALVGEDLTSTPSPQIHSGVYYMGLTQDDIGGLKYIYSRNNVNSEDVIAGTTLRLLDTNTVVLLQGIDAFNFMSNAVFVGASNVVTQFPLLAGNIRTNTLVSISTNVITTNIIVTNIPINGLSTNLASLTVISNLDLFTFSERSRTNDAGTLRAQYPGLIITSTNTTPALQTVESYYLTNYPWTPIGSAPSVATNIINTIVPNYAYTYANLITNYAAVSTTVEIDTVTLTSNGFITNKSSLKTNVPSGGFYILDRTTNANLFAYAFSNAVGVPLLRVTNIVKVTNQLAAVPLAGFQKFSVNTFTNVTYAAYPILFNAGASAVVTNLTTNTVVRFGLTLESFLANFLFVPPSNGNTNAIVQTINGLNPANVIITTNTVPSPFPIGTVLIYDPDSFVLTGNRFETSGLATNVITTFTDPATGQFFTQLLIYQTNSILFEANPVTLQAATGPLLRPGVNSIRFRQIPFTDFLNQSNAVSTNIYSTVTLQNNEEVTLQTRRVAGPDILFTAGDLGVSTGGIPIAYARGIAWQQGTTIIAGGAQADEGPGLVVPGNPIAFSKVIPFNFSQNPNFTDEQNSEVFFAWGSFDNKTITPRIYPEELNTQLTFEQLQALALRRIP
jgi:hypothetical protein